MTAVVESIGRVGSRSRVGNHEMVFDQPRGVPGGEDRGPSPLDVMVLSVAACVHYFASAFLFGRGHATDAVTVEVESEKDRVPLSRIGRLTIKVRLPAGLSEGELRGVERAIKGCPAYGTLRHPPAVEITVEAAPPSAGRDAPHGLIPNGLRLQRGVAHRLRIPGDAFDGRALRVGGHPLAKGRRRTAEKSEP